MDSGATNHVTFQTSLLEDFQTLAKDQHLVVGNDDTCLIKGLGKVTLKTHLGAFLVLDQVLFVPSMSRNLISVSQLTAHKKFNIQFVNDTCTIGDTKTQQPVAQADMIDHLFSLRLESPTTAMITHQSSVGLISDSTLWHARLGHIGESKLINLHKPQLYRHVLPKLPPLPFCEPCALGKIKRHPFAKVSAYRARQLIELVHTNLCGPISQPSFGGSNYFMPFIDDKSRMTFTYYLRHKSQAVDMFKQFVLTSERQTGLKLKQIRTDGAGELTSAAFQEFCAQQGIVHQVTVPYSSEMNGVAEIKHQNLHMKPELCCSKQDSPRHTGLRPSRQQRTSLTGFPANPQMD